MIKLTVLAGPDTGNVFVQSTSPIVMGRNNDCDVVLHDGAVSRRHCVIESCGDAFVVSDLRSPNGVFLNDPKNRIDSHVLKNGDEIIFGRSRVRVELPVVVDVKAKTPAEESGSGSIREVQSPSLTIEDALTADSSLISLPSSWQDGMTVCTPRAKLVATLDPSTERTGAQSALAALAKKNRAADERTSGLFTGLIIGIRKFFSGLRFSS